MDVNDNDPGRSYNVHGTMCVLHRQARRRTALGLLGLPHEPPVTGLDLAIIESLPTIVFRHDLKDGAIECAVCISNLEDGEMIRFLPNCEHNFHVACIDTWLGTNTTCAVCRTVAEPMKVVLTPVVATPEAAKPIDVESTDRTGEDSGKYLVHHQG
uniref:RING-type E3 ubiquitin transferase n=1 Tax=Daucus carota subsp. sativus TaxID=79200 RepID=A0A164W6Q8_DAUCS